MMVNGTILSMVRGDSESISITLNNYTPAPGDFIEFTVRRKIGAAIAIHKKVEQFSGQKAFISISPEDTNGLPFGEYVYDIQLTFGGLVKTVVKPSKFVIGEEVTYG